MRVTGRRGSALAFRCWLCWENSRFGTGLGGAAASEGVSGTLELHPTLVLCCSRGAQLCLQITGPGKPWSCSRTEPSRNFSWFKLLRIKFFPSSRLKKSGFFVVSVSSISIPLFHGNFAEHYSVSFIKSILRLTRAHTLGPSYLAVLAHPSWSAQPLHLGLRFSVILFYIYSILLFVISVISCVCYFKFVICYFWHLL